MVENLQALVGHADFVDIRKEQAEVQVMGPEFAGDGVVFKAQVLRWFADQRQTGLQGRPRGSGRHGGRGIWCHTDRQVMGGCVRAHAARKS